MSRCRRLFRLAPLATGALLGGCLVGPDYDGPPKVAPVAETKPAFHRATVAPTVPSPPLATWWTALGDAKLDRLETLALATSPTLAKAEASIRKARATLGERRAALLPSGGGTAFYLRADLPSTPATNTGMSGGGAAGGAAGGAGGGAAGGGSGGAAAGAGATSSTNLPAFNLYNAGIDAIWQLDLFGGTRRRVESARADVEYQQAELEDAQVTLTADVAKAYVNLRDTQNRLILAKANTGVQLRMLALTKVRRAGGTASDVDVERVFTQLKQTQAKELPLQGQVEIYTDQLSQLTGQEPGTLDAELKDAVRLPLPPAKTAIGDPASFLRRRPDIRAAERKMASQNAQIGYNISRYFPSVSLFGTIGSATTMASTLFTGGSLTYIAGPTLSWNFLNLPTLTAQVRGARADYDEAVASYRRTVLSALLDAENGLSRFGHQRDNVASLADAAASAARSAGIARTRYAGGTLSLIDALDVERQRLQTQSSLAEGQAELTKNWVALQSSLGLGWGAPSPREDRGTLIPATAAAAQPR